MDLRRAQRLEVGRNRRRRSDGDVLRPRRVKVRRPRASRTAPAARALVRASQRCFGMKNTLLLAMLALLPGPSFAAAPAGLDVPFCSGTQAQLARDPAKRDRMKYAQEAATRYYPYLEGALRRLVAQTPHGRVCSRPLIVGKNDAFAGLSKLKYFIRFEVSSGAKLVAAIPVFMVNTSEQGHMNPGEKQWMPLDTTKTRAILGGLPRRYRPTILIEGAPEIEGPDFASFIHRHPIGRMMVSPENTLVLPLGANADGKYYLLTGFYELHGMYETQVSTKALLFLKDKRGHLLVNNELDAYRDVMVALGDARKPAPPARDLEAQIRATLDGARSTRLLP